jgi:peptidoglycan/xylan/chitin deacetylase (PgdA/CDA1 family)
MNQPATRLRKAVLSALHYSGADSMIAPFTRGIGAIFRLHHVFPDTDGAVEPNHIMKVTPHFLEQVIHQVRVAGFDIVSLDDAHFRMLEGYYDKPFVCFTFDDGNRDTYEHAYPVFQRYELPFAVYVPTDFPDGHGDLWWLALETVVFQVDGLDVKIEGTQRRFKCTTPAEKSAAFASIYGWLRSINEDDARAYVHDMCANAGVESRALCSEVMMTWDEIRQMAVDPRVTIGAQTRRHYALAKLTLAEARAEIEESVRRITRETGGPCRHFSYPYGDETSAGPREFDIVREMGLKTGVTTRNGLIRREHGDKLTALPRLTLRGDYQHPRYVKVLLSGVTFAFTQLMQAGSSRPHP